MIETLKRSAKLSISCAVLGALVLPMQNQAFVPVPHEKPALIDGAIVPKPAAKPDFFAGANTLKNKKTGVVSASFMPLVLKHESMSAEYKPLTGRDAKLYREIFDLQRAGQMKKANHAIAKIKDQRLLGYVLYQRYMHPSYKTSYNELKNWMAHYADQPGASKIYKLANTRRPEGDNHNAPVKAPTLSQVKEPDMYYGRTYRSQAKRSHAQNVSFSKLERKIHNLTRKGRMQIAYDALNNEDALALMDNVEHDRLLAQIASGYLYRGHTSKAQALAIAAADRSGSFVPEAGWIAGLSLWQEQEYEKASNYFGQTGDSAYASGWMASAGSYWAARCFDMLGQDDDKFSALQNAATHKRTFYGLLAHNVLGQNITFNWKKPAFTKDDKAVMMKEERGRRAFSLIEAGRHDLAEAELFRLNYKGNAALRKAVLAYAGHIGLPGLSLRLGNFVARQDGGGHYESALYPKSPWEPDGGYKVDPALVHAIIRQESRFDVAAKSYSGALGLMQLMPQTASYIAKKSRMGHVSRHDLREPELNIKLGQNYVDYLLKNSNVKGDVVSLLVAYNAGPGNLSKWKKQRAGAPDPLLFIETLPVQETRDYVEKVLSNYWIYRLQSGQNVPSLAALSKGKTPRYAYADPQSDFIYQLAGR